MAIRGLFKRMLSIVLGLALGLLIAEAAVRLFYRGPLISRWREIGLGHKPQS